MLVSRDGVHAVPGRKSVNFAGSVVEWPG